MKVDELKVSEQYIWLIDFMRPIMKEICKIFLCREYNVLLTDENSRILAVESSKSFNDSEIEINEDREITHDNQYEFKSKEYSSFVNTSLPIKDDNKIVAYLIITGYTLFNEELKKSLTLLNRTIEIFIQVCKEKNKAEKQNKLYEYLLDATDSGILSVDMNGIITHVNEEAATVLNAGNDVIGKNISDIIDVVPTVLRVLRTGKSYINKEIRIERNNNFLHYLTSAFPYTDSGKTMGAIQILRNMDEIIKVSNRIYNSKAKYKISNIIGESPEILEVKKMIKFAGANADSVLIIGGRGTGKSITAQAIHNCSNRRNGPFIILNCSQIPKDLIDVELFGYHEDVFAKDGLSSHPGKLELANGGTLVLKNVDCIPYSVQIKLSKFINQKKVVRNCGFNEIPFDVRIICTLTTDYSEINDKKNLIEEFYKTISSINIFLPSLKARQMDIELIAANSLNQYNVAHGTNKKLSKEVMGYLNNHNWPENVRELENVIEYVYYKAEGDVILPEHLYEIIKDKDRQNKF